MAGFMYALGDDPVGWRASALVSGVSTIAIGGVAAARLFRDPRAGVIAAALLGSDGFLIAYSRAGLLDGLLGTCAALAVLIASTALTPLVLVAAAILAGAAASIKLTGITVLAPLAVWILLAPTSRARRALWLAALLLGALAAYVASFVLGLTLAGQSGTAIAAIEKTLELIRHHAGLTDMKHPLTSGWITWLVPTRPILLGFAEEGGRVRALSSLGNLAIWWSAAAFGVAATAKLTWLGLGAAVRQSPPDNGRRAESIDGFLRTHGRGTLVLLAAVFGFLSPWVLTHRDSYIYHYLPSYVGLILLLSGYLASCYGVRPALVTSWLAAVLLVLAFYAPVWSFMSIERGGFEWRLPFRHWR
jgi:dolichyl-phosphate-mannose--protein O-mannosyl transferase